ncbi:DUF5986 family protein [Sporosarcina limicola]|uniref:Uncharacterized protein n=1 Tax=Sporosarcina limicola TaxID=34101 RepID=A0A927MHR3_9BACL|nr:DUF5986 family protein [Sporosarcina limicola]MBE1554843.1 hypothetical protein [Sporosarcina limicola]
MGFKLSQDTESKISIIRSIQDGIEIAKAKKEETEPFDNGHGIRKWGYLYQSFSESEIEELLLFITKRQSWKLPFMIAPLDKTLYCLLSKQNLEIKQKKKTKIMHYVSAISAVVNENFEDKLSEDQKREIQLMLDLEIDNKKAKQIYEEMLGEVTCEIEQFCVLTLDFVRYELIGIEANILNENFDVLYSEDWSSLIKVSSMDENDLGRREQEAQQHDVKTPLKHKRKKQQE